MTPPAKPKTPVEALHSDAAEKQHGIDIEGWGDSMALQINRLACWAKDNGMKDAPCKR